MNFIKRNFKSIAISFVVGVVIFYLQPFLDILGKAFVNFIIYVNENISNVYYKSIAVDDPNLFSQNNSLVLVLLFEFVLFIIFVNIKNFNYEVSKLKMSFRDSLNTTLSPAQIEKRNNIELENNLIELEKSISIKSNALDRRVKLLDRLFLFTSVILFLLIFFNHSFKKSISEKNLEFRNRLIVIKPYVDIQEIDMLKSKWARIENLNDYNNTISYLLKLEEEFLIE
ncbi:hypothetical protein [Algoriphagus pacificus]|uniref:Uncharacterized protein n=1 Tax=Algoriphagus pacificus TaxID=2811234 RepID=A0ABS3CIC8_9BACT|nr:hypothetical protein [Algoriphagus pacificus]MBN7816797.1 hypothetical protein [Algoriphagus pacificus]